MLPVCLALQDAQPRREASGVKPSTPDMNLVLTGAGDWGMGGRGRGFEPAPSLPATKPTERQLTETGGLAWLRAPGNGAPSCRACGAEVAKGATQIPMPC